MVAINVLGQVMTFVSDPEVVQDMWTTQNQFFSKSSKDVEKFSKPLLKGVFGTMDTNEKWKKQRKACQHMFLKDRLQAMSEIFKMHLNQACDRWQAEIEEKGEARVDINAEFVRFYGNNINHITLGEDIQNEKFEFHEFDRET